MRRETDSRQHLTSGVFVAVLKTGASGMIAYRLLTKDLKWQWLQTSSRLVYTNSKPDYIISTHRPLMWVILYTCDICFSRLMSLFCREEEGRDLFGKRTMDFKVTYLDAGLTSTYMSDGDLGGSGGGGGGGGTANGSVGHGGSSSSNKLAKRHKTHLRDFLSTQVSFKRYITTYKSAFHDCSPSRYRAEASERARPRALPQPQPRRLRPPTTSTPARRPPPAPPTVLPLPPPPPPRPRHPSPPTPMGTPMRIARSTSRVRTTCRPRTRSTLPRPPPSPWRTATSPPSTWPATAPSAPTTRSTRPHSTTTLTSPTPPGECFSL